MERQFSLGILLSAVLFASVAFAAQNVGNTSQKGSLLIFPLIDIRGEDARTTIIDISNDSNLSVYVNCNYVNEKKGRIDFHFTLTAKDTASWDVLTHSGAISPAVFPNNGTFPYGNPDRGELICFAVDATDANQVRFNHLSGTATVVYFTDTDANQPRQAFKYNAWAFTAESTAVPPPPDGTPVGTPGNIVLSGNGDGTYDACPAYLIANFSPSGASLGGISYLDNNLSVSICKQDLRQDFVLRFTKLEFEVWNEYETEYSGSFQCTDSVRTLDLDRGDQPGVNGIVGPENFSFGVLETANARFQVAGVSSTQCQVLENTGLVGVLSTSIGIDGTSGVTEGKDAELGSTLHGAGVAVNSSAGFVLWDPQRAVVPETSKH